METRTVWIGARGGKWHIAADQREAAHNFTNESRARCGVRFVPFNVSLGKPPTMARHVCSHCMPSTGDKLGDNG
jgi:hypothetical protein